MLFVLFHLGALWLLSWKQVLFCPSYSKIEVLKWNIIYYMVKNEDHGELSKLHIYKFIFLIKKIIICVEKPM